MTNIQTPTVEIDNAIVSSMAAELVEGWTTYRDDDSTIHRKRFAEWVERTFSREDMNVYLGLVHKLSEEEIKDLRTKAHAASLIATKHMLAVMAARSSRVVGLDEFKAVNPKVERRLRELAAFGSSRRVDGLFRRFSPSDFEKVERITLADIEDEGRIEEAAIESYLEDRDEFVGVRLDDGRLVLIWLQRTDEVGTYVDDVTGEERSYRYKRCVGFRPCTDLDDAKATLRGVAQHFRSQYEPEVVPEEQEQPLTVDDLEV